MVPRYLVDFHLHQLPEVKTDVIVVGGGIAGLYTALKAAENHRVIILAKKTLLDSNTQFAQGGIAAVMSTGDSPLFHRQDTLTAGAGLCSMNAVDVLVHEGPESVQDLIRMGIRFDQENGELALTREGAHSRRRILHANGDATGAEIVRALSEQVRRNPNTTLWNDHFVLDVITEDYVCHGVLVQKGDGSRLFVQGKATILCSGGAGQLYPDTTNPDIATGDGIAMAYRAGAYIRDMEFVQFHPTALYVPGAPRFLISEALRGEGAVLRNMKGERFMERYHSLLELAPRDIVARAIVSEIGIAHRPFVYLDITHESEERLKQRFPTIYQFCLQYGLHLATDWIPVAPAAHYMMGGIKTNLNGETTISRLFACGECSSTGVHGANRLASNSLSEAIVFGRRIVERISHLADLTAKPFIRYDLSRTKTSKLATIERRLEVQKAMLRFAAVHRNHAGLERGYAILKRQLPFLNARLTKRDQYEMANLLMCGMLVLKASILRQESRGGHFRDDFPKSDERNWRKHIVMANGKEPIEEEI